MAPNVLIFAEDPGAALFLKDLPDALRAHGATPLLVAGPFAAPYFAGESLAPPPDARGAASAAAILAQYRPDTLVVGTSENPDSFAFDLIHAAAAAGVATVGAVDSAPNAEHRFRGRTGDPLGHLPEALLVPDRASEEAYLRLGVPADRVVVCGHPQFHAIQSLRRVWTAEHRSSQRARWFPDVPARVPVFLFVSELSVGLGDNPFRKTPQYFLHGTSGSEARSDIVAEEFVRAARALPSPAHLVLRLHPKQSLEQEAAIAGLFDQVSQSEPALEIANAADLVVGMTSILLSEAAILGRPVLSIVPRPEERDWLGDMASRIDCVWSRADIEAKLREPPFAQAVAGETAPPAQLMAQAILARIRIAGDA